MVAADRFNQHRSSILRTTAAHGSTSVRLARRKPIAILCMSISKASGSVRFHGNRERTSAIPMIRETLGLAAPHAKPHLLQSRRFRLLFLLGLQRYIILCMKAIPIHCGQVFTRWTVLKEVPFRKGHRRIQCRCACGTVGIVNLQSLRIGQSRSCGCLRKETNIRHGMWQSSEYSIWAQMLYRCSPKRRPQASWKNYGGRGIRVCKEWRASFQAFFAHVGKRPSPLHSLDRINNDGNYEPGNVRWATRSQQRANKRATIWERALLIMAAHRGIADDWIRASIKRGMSDKELAQHIARTYLPESR